MICKEVVLEVSGNKRKQTGVNDLGTPTDPINIEWKTYGWPLMISEYQAI